MKVTDEALEEYAERFISEDIECKTGMNFNQYLYTMLKLNELVEGDDLECQMKQQKKSLSQIIKHYLQKIMQLIRTN